MGELHVAPGTHLLAEIIAIIRRLDIFKDRRALCIHRAQGAIIQIHAALGADQAHVAGGKAGKCLVQNFVGTHEGFVECQGLAAPADDLVDVAAERVAVFHRQVLVDAAGDAEPRVNAPAAGGGDHLLPVFANEDRPFTDFGKFLQNPDDVSLRHRCRESEQQVGRGEMKKIHRVRLQHLGIMHQAPHLLRRRRDAVHAGDHVHHLAGAEMMTDRTDAAQALDDDRNLPVHASADEPFEAAELHDMEARLLDLAGRVEPDGHLAVAFDAGDRIDDDFSAGLADLDVASSFVFQQLYDSTGSRPVSSALSASQMVSAEGGQPGRK